MKVIIASILWSPWVAGMMYCPDNRRASARIDAELPSVLARAREAVFPVTALAICASAERNQGGV
jgi:hypothetical protein